MPHAANPQDADARELVLTRLEEGDYRPPSLIAMSIANHETIAIALQGNVRRPVLDHSEVDIECGAGC